MTLHRALVVRALDQEVYVKIPSILGANETISVYRPTNVGADWPPADGDQLLVAVEGENFNKVYLVCNITDTTKNINGGNA
jgi:hypothetical protein